MLVIDEVQSTCERGRQSLAARVRLDQQEFGLWFKWNGAACPCPGDLLFLTGIQPAMRTGCDLHIRHPVSAELQEAIPVIQQHFRQQAPELGMINVQAAVQDPLNSPAAPQQQDLQKTTGVLFDGGVDAFFTYLTHQKQVQTIVYIADYVGDQEIQRGKGTAIKSAELRSRDLGKPFLRVETNLREFLSTFNNDLRFDQTLAVTIIDSLLCGHLDKLVIPGSHGSSLEDGIDEDGCFSFMSYLPGRRLYFDRPGALIDHSAKLEELKVNNDILEALRVCWENPRRTYNCGRCTKCTRRVSPARLVELLSRESRLALANK